MKTIMLETRFNNRTALRICFERGVIHQATGAIIDARGRQRTWVLDHKTPGLWDDDSWYELHIDGIYERIIGDSVDQVLDQGEQLLHDYGYVGRHAAC